MEIGRSRWIWNIFYREDLYKFFDKLDLRNERKWEIINNYKG